MTLSGAAILLDDILSQLPKRTEQPLIKTDQGEAFSISPDPIEGYVSPTVTITSWPQNACVLLIEAPGAVGKSELAQAMAKALNWPIVKAEKAQVGSYTLSGLIQDALGFASSYMQELALGSAGVIVDSLDEAHFRAGITNFLAFLDNIQRSAGAFESIEARKPSVVLLSRSDTAEFIRFSFQERGFPLAEGSLDFFDENGAKGFISAYYRQRFKTTRRAEYNVDLASPIPFERLRKDRFSQVARVLHGGIEVDFEKNWDQVREFLGYAPVLIALAEFLAVPNPSAERRDTVTAFDQRALLQDIVERILDREHNKLGLQIRDKLQAALPAVVGADIDANQLYSPTEQLIRLASRLGKNDLMVPPPAALPLAVRPVYEEAVGSFVSDHPFVRGKEFASVVFADYVSAAVCTSLEARAALAIDPDRNIGEVGPFFASFLIAQFAGRQPEIREPLLGAVLSSWGQEGELRASSQHVVSAFLWDGDVGAVSLYRNEKAEPVEIMVTELSGALHLSGNLKNLSLVTDQGVILGTRDENLIIGPNVVIVAGEIDVECRSIFIESLNQMGAFLGATTFTANYLSQIDARPDTFIIYTDNPPPRLRNYTQKLTAPGVGRVPFSDYVCLRSVLTSFRPSTKAGPSVYCEKLDNAIIKNKPERLRVMNLLMSAGCLIKDGNHYRLDLNALAKLGFNLNDVKTGEPNAAILNFLAV